MASIKVNLNDVVEFGEVEIQVPRDDVMRMFAKYFNEDPNRSMAEMLTYSMNTEIEAGRVLDSSSHELDPLS